MESLPTIAQNDSPGANTDSVKSEDSSPHHDPGRGSPPPNCAICLGMCRNKSFTDSCLHQFCFKCLLTWSKVKAECPLCKQNFRSIIHNVKSNLQYEEYMVEQRHTEDLSDRIDIESLTAAARRFRYRTTLTLPRQDSIAIQQLLLHHYHGVAQLLPNRVVGELLPNRVVGELLPNGVVGELLPNRVVADLLPGRLVPRRRSPASFRRTVYRYNLWARPLPDFTRRFRDCSPEFYRHNTSQMHRLVPWLNRELHYLLNENVGHIAYVVARILELLPQFSINLSEFREAMRRYLGDNTDHFLHELYCFASTPYDMNGYDRNVQYTTDSSISTMVNEVLSSSDSEASVDSDIVMISSSGPADPPPGPSRASAPVYPQSRVVPIETISHSDTDDDSSEVMVVGYIKPPQDRTPEVVDLLGSDSDVVVQDSAPPEPESLPPSLVKLTLRRHSHTPDSDSDGSAYTPSASPLARRRRGRSDDTATTADTRRTTPTPPASHFSYLSLLSASPSYRSDTSSDSPWSDSSDWTKKKPRRKLAGPKRNTSKTKKRSSRMHRKSNKDERPNASPVKEKASKHKSHSGKGVKCSKKFNVGEDGAVQPAVEPERASPAPEEPGTSGTSTGRKRKPERSTQRRESKRLRSVVNVVSSQTSSELASQEPVGSDRARESAARQYPASESDSEDDLPLNLSVMKGARN